MPASGRLRLTFLLLAVVMLAGSTAVVSHSFLAAISTATGPMSIMITSPNGGETWTKGASYRIQYTVSAVLPSPQWSYDITHTTEHLYLVSSSGQKILINESSCVWACYNIGGDTPSSRSFSIDYVVPGDLPAGQYKLQKEISYTWYPGYEDPPRNEMATDYSNANFTVVDAVPGQPLFRSMYPSGGETWMTQTEQEIGWSVTNVDPSAKADISLVNYARPGSPVSYPVATSVGVVRGSDGLFHGFFTYPLMSDFPAAGSMFKVNIRYVVGGVIYEKYSDNYFTIVRQTDSITVLSPNGNEQWVKGSSKNISWAAFGVGDVWLTAVDSNGAVYQITTSNHSPYSWLVGRQGNSYYMPPGRYKIKIYDAAAPTAGAQDVSNDFFDIVSSICGDSSQSGSEVCDDGNAVSGDGCSSTCTLVEPGWVCSGYPRSTCRKIVCGDGMWDYGEACDDGDTTNGDGCSSVCVVESGWNCYCYPRNVCNQSSSIPACPSSSSAPSSSRSSTRSSSRSSSCSSSSALSSSSRPSSSSSRSSSSAPPASSSRSSSSVSVCDGTDTIGLANSAGSFFFRNSKTAGPADATAGFGASGWKQFTGDWDGDGLSTPGAYDPAASVFYLTNAQTGGYAQLTFGFGAPGAGWLPVIGDWNGDGTDTIGLYDPSAMSFYLSNANATGNADIMFTCGARGNLPIAGDWNADGTDTIGLFESSTAAFSLRNSFTCGPADIAFTLPDIGNGFQPIAGDWNADGIDSVGRFRAEHSEYYLLNANAYGYADYAFTFGTPGTSVLPLAGRWCAGGRPLREACRDGIDNDGDGKVDYPADPGCITPADPNETNAVSSSSSILPSSSSRPSSSSAPSSSSRPSSSSVPSSSSFPSSSSVPSSSSRPSSSSVPASSSSPSSSLASSSSRPSSSSAPSSSASSSSSRPSSSSISSSPVSHCGDLAIQPPEQCDDGNLTAGDGCSASCTFECTDSDGGNNSSSPGTVRSSWTRTPVNPLRIYTKTDYCSGSTLYEYSCLTTAPYAGAIGTYTVTCAKGCANGACLP